MPTKENNPAKESKQTEVTAKSTPPWPLITVGVVGSVVILILFIVTWFAIARSHNLMSPMAYNKHGINRGGFFYHRQRDMYMVQPVAEGVITAINGNNLTVSGDGQQVTVNKTDNTTVNGDKSDVAVNDTVVVFGDKASDGTITATRIAVQNELLSRASAPQSSEMDLQPRV